MGKSVNMRLHKSSLHVCYAHAHISSHIYKCMYSETSLIRPPLEPNFMALIMRWPY